MIYDSIIDLFKMLFSSIEFLKPYATTGGILWLILKQNSIRKIINGQLPKRFRDTRDSDLLEMKQDIKDIKSHFGVVVSNTQQNGSKATPILLYKRFFLLLQEIMKPQKRRSAMINQIWRANLSKKLISALVSIAIVALNRKFGLGISEEYVWGILGLSAAHISLQTIIDSIRAWANSKTKVVIAQTTDPLVIAKLEAMPMTFAELNKYISEMAQGINKITAAAKAGDTVAVRQDITDTIMAIHQFVTKESA